MRLFAATCLLLSLLHAAPAVADDIPALMRAGQWQAAEDAASHYADPVARKLVIFHHLLSPGGGSAATIAAFLADSPDWPRGGELLRRRDEALLSEPDDEEARRLCAGVRLPAALLRCADAWDAAGQSSEAAADRRLAWVTGLADPASEARFTQRFGSLLGPDDQWRRFGNLLGQEAAAARQMARLDAPHRQAAETVIALRRNDRRAAAMLAAVSPALGADPLLFLEQARWLRRATRDTDALLLWQRQGEAAQAAAGPGRAGTFWTERQILARELLATGDAAGAYALATLRIEGDPESEADAAFLAGWVALRRLNDPTAAAAQFRRLAGLSGAAITQGRAHYWLARALAATGDAKGAQAELTAGARWLTTYYGQLCSLALGDDPAALTRRLAALRDPPWQPEEALVFLGHELARAAVLLASWGDAGGARVFLLRLHDLVPAPAERAMTARLATGFGMVDQAVAIARRAGRDGVMLPQAGWPAPFQPPGDVEPPLALAIMRQESNFNPSVVSSAGARGLMQMMPATASAVARQAGVQVTPAALLADSTVNMRLGSAYLATLLAQENGSIPLAVAAYNAGPTRVAQWLAQNGDPRTEGATDMIDWIELIPFNETRNYVQRVIENLMIYRAREGAALPDPALSAHDKVALLPPRG